MWWIHEIIKQRKTYGVNYHLVEELELDSERFHFYFPDDQGTVRGDHVSDWAITSQSQSCKRNDKWNKIKANLV